MDDTMNAPAPEAAEPVQDTAPVDAHALPEVGFDAFSEAVDAWTDVPDDFKADLSGGHRGLPDIKKILSEYVTPEARRFVGNLRADYTRKTQDLARLKRELELEREAISREKLARVDGPAARKAAALARRMRRASTRTSWKTSRSSSTSRRPEPSPPRSPRSARCWRRSAPVTVPRPSSTRTRR